jgi:hypothetical protein
MVGMGRVIIDGVSATRMSVVGAAVLSGDFLFFRGIDASVVTL